MLTDIFRLNLKNKKSSNKFKNLDGFNKKYRIIIKNKISNN
jgi:hypothetical protein